MNVHGQRYRSIWIKEQSENIICIIDQRHLPHALVVEEIASVEEMARAIADMHVRGAILIGAAAGYGMYLASLTAPDDERFDAALQAAGDMLKETRPTAVNLAWAVDRQLEELTKGLTTQEKRAAIKEAALAIEARELEHCRLIGEHGAELIEDIQRHKNGETVNILTHCNAGWLACVDYGTATAPMYAAFERGLDVHIWVDETRPRNQGAALTAWELGGHGVKHTVIPDNTGGHLMQRGMVDLVIVGTDRTTRSGDVANKIGTYLKALAAWDNDIPFYVAAPSSSIDWTTDADAIPIEQRNGDEVRYVQGKAGDAMNSVLITPENSPVANYGFDITPARLVTGIISERGICDADTESLARLFPEFSPQPV